MKIEKYKEFYDDANSKSAEDFYNDVKTLSDNEKVILFSLKEKDLYSSYMMYKMETEKNTMFFILKIYLILQFIGLAIAIIMILFNDGTIVTTVQ